MESEMEKLGISIKAKHIVKPSEPTWQGSIPLAEWDQTGMLTHVQTIYFYKPSQDWLKPSNKIINHLINSLSQVLVHFYPMAGRLRWIGKGRLELDCNCEGASIIEAESASKIEDFGTLFHPLPEFKHLIPQVDYKNTPINEQPLYLVQVTKFKCGGVSIGMAISHVATDGQSALHFIQEWCGVSRGEVFGAKPFLDRTVLRAGEPYVSSPRFDHTEFDDPPCLIGEKSGKNQKLNETKSEFFKLTRNQVAALKKTANEGSIENTRPYSRYEAITAHMWKCASEARNLKHDQPTSMYFCVDTRGRLNPPLPRHYFGNAIIDVAATTLAGDLIKHPLSHASSVMRSSIAKINHDYANSNIDYLKSQDDLSIFQNIPCFENNNNNNNNNNNSEGENEGVPFYGNPNMSVLSWLTLEGDGLDYGWGKEYYMGPGKSEPEDGESLLMPGHLGDGSVIVALCLQVDHMNAFKKIFYRDIK